MSLINSVSYDKNVLYDDSFWYKGVSQRIYFQKSYMRANKTEQYFLKLFILENEKLVCQGYIYFYLNFITKTSDFIGIYIKPEYRNCGLASLLVSNWILFCMNNGFDCLGTNKAQRKPFLLYLLKTYGFEIFDPTIYQKSSHVIHICKKEQDNSKYLLFENQKQKESFMHGKIAIEDNYQVVDKLDVDMNYLDSVILSQKYDLIDLFHANEKSILVMNRHKK